MPLYDYKCECGEKFDKILPIDKRDEGICPKCGKKCKHIITPVRHVWVGPPEWASSWQQGKVF